MSKVRKRKHGKMPDARQDVNCYHGFAMGRTITPTGETEREQDSGGSGGRQNEHVGWHERSGRVGGAHVLTLIYLTKLLSLSSDPSWKILNHAPKPLEQLSRLQ